MSGNWSEDSRLTTVVAMMLARRIVDPLVDPETIWTGLRPTTRERFRLHAAELLGEIQKYVEHGRISTPVPSAGQQLENGATDLWEA